MRPIVLARIFRGKIFRVHEIPRVAARARVKHRERRARSVALVVAALLAPPIVPIPPLPRIGIKRRGEASGSHNEVRQKGQFSALISRTLENSAFRAFPLTSVKSAFQQRRTKEFEHEGRTRDQRREEKNEEGERERRLERTGR